MAEYKYDKSLASEQHNTLVMLDAALAKADLAMRPSFEILGGTAMTFHSIDAVFTVDIDLANKQQKQVKEIVEPFVSDMAADVATLPRNYRERLVPYSGGEFESFDVYLLSIEDLVITKLGSWRVKDQEDLAKTDILKKADLRKVQQIINTEFKPDMASKLLVRFSSI